MSLESKDGLEHQPTDRRALLAGLGGLAAGTFLTAGRAEAGPLTPPGPPAPTPGPEPRIAINATNTPGGGGARFVISQPGSYYLPGHVTIASLTNGIHVESDDVTIDFMGYSLTGMTSAQYGLRVVGTRRSIVIRNGFISGFIFSGVQGTIHNGVIEGIHVRDIAGWGFRIFVTSMMRFSNCSAFNNRIDALESGGFRITGPAVMDGCLSRENKGHGILVEGQCTILNSLCLLNDGSGFQIDGGSSVFNCASHGNSGLGFRLAPGCFISQCSATANGNSGIAAFGQCHIAGNTCDFNGRDNSGTNGAGIHAASSGNRIEGNNCTRNGQGIRIIDAGNIIARNTCSSSVSSNWNIATGNSFGPIINRAGNLSPPAVGDAAISSIATTDPWANFTI